MPNSGKHEIWSVTLRNVSDTAKSVKLISYARCELDGRYRPQGYNLGKGGFFGDKNAVYAHVYSEFYSKRCVNVWGFMSSSEKPAAFDSRRNAFIGTYGDEQHPLQSPRARSAKQRVQTENSVGTLKRGNARSGREKPWFTPSACAHKGEIRSYSKQKPKADMPPWKQSTAIFLSGVKIKPRGSFRTAL